MRPFVLVVTGAPATNNDLMADALNNLFPIGLLVVDIANVNPQFNYKMIVLLLGTSFAVVLCRIFKLDSFKGMRV